MHKQLLRQASVMVSTAEAALLYLYQRDIGSLVEDLDDEAAEAAIDNNPRRAFYLQQHAEQLTTKARLGL